ncbi:hypothetical protein MBGDN05_00117 [Thermoplasmatales archaeon SCGC AB-539-N05]|nr:hypothetical protein MBGDN05_00117 [Thermoplasmatales archaeon SCGC AB-539-N05]
MGENFTIKKANLKTIIAASIVLILLASAILPITVLSKDSTMEGFDKGPSYKPVVPMKKVTFVNFDEESYLDDYAYLAAVPTSVFNDGNKLFSNPLLFYQDEYPVKEDKERSLNARQGLDYFMEDWMSYCNGKLDQLTLINVAENKMDNSWKSEKTTEIKSDGPYEIASKLALSEWSYADDAVIAVIESEFEKPTNVTTNKITGKISDIKGIKNEFFSVKQTSSLDPIFKEFNVPDGYKYIKSETTWDLLSLLKGAINIPRGDPDTQLYCQYENGWLETSIGQQYTQMQGPSDYTDSYVYQNGLWKIGITEVPVFSNSGPNSNFFGILKNIFSGSVTYKVKISLFEGTELEIPEDPPYECTDVDLKLTWDNPDVTLGFSLIGPGGEEVLSVANESRTGSQELHLERIGQCIDGRKYKVCVFLMDDVTSSIDFEVEYSWKQRINKEEGNALASATEGAVLASTLNAPLLYTTKSKVPECTKDALYKLGVENIHFVNIGDCAEDEILEELESIAEIKYQYNTLEDVYKDIIDETGSNDVIFSTIDPWTKWYIGELKPGDETEAALFIGPAAYIAAHHGAPVLIVDNHPELSSAIIYHNEFWRRYADDRFYHTVSIASMFFTGKQVYKFLEKNNFDQKGMETMITIADQYEIGASWDRIFAGVAKPGRFCGTPVDTSYWISRSMFYPALIYVNPALTDELTLVNGSCSTRKPLGVFSYPYANTLTITKPSQEENFKYPVLQSYTSGMNHRFNERASKYYGSKYQCADGTIPGETVSFNPIDQGVLLKHEGKEGAYCPDMTASEIIPFYLKKGGYDNVFSTNFEITMENLNKGAVLYFGMGHGMEHNGGTLQFWNPKEKFESKTIAKFFTPFIGATKEENPWRGYEWYLGSTEEPDTMTRDLKGAIPFTNIPCPFLKTGLDLVLARKPIREFINKIIPIFDPFEVDNLYDGVVMTDYFSQYGAKPYNGVKIDDALDNIHSCGYITSACETSNTYLHTSFTRHGSVFQIMDPWATSFYASVWTQSVSRDIVLGDTIGEAYVKGISKVGVLYITDPPQWWWDKLENVCFYGDPDLRPFVPSTEYSDNNNWEKDDVQPIRYDEDLSINGHMPYGATSYPHETTPMLWMQYIWIIIAIALLATIVIIAFVFFKRRKR